MLVAVLLFQHGILFASLLRLCLSELLLDGEAGYGATARQRRQQQAKCSSLFLQIFFKIAHLSF